MNPPKKQPSNFAVGSVLFLAFSVFLTFSTFVVGKLIVEPRRLAKEAEGWQKTECVIREITIQSHTSSSRGAGSGATYSSNTTYSPKVRIEYVVDGQSYTSEKFWFGSSLFSTTQEVEKIIAPYKKDQTAVCYVSPDNPAEAVVSRILYDKDYTGWLWLVVFIIFGVMGLVFAVWLAFLAKSNQHAVVTFEPDFSPLGGALAVWGLAVVWNGIVGLIFYLGVQGNMPLSAKLLVGFFGLIGLLVIVGACFKTYDALCPPPPEKDGRVQSQPAEQIPIPAEPGR